jgi:hypothetical protein
MNTLRNIAAFVAVFLVGSLTMFALHEWHMTIWPEETMPASSASTEEFRAWMETLSMPTMIAATVVHWLGTPMWLTVTDALGYLPVALMTGKLMART